MTNSPQIEAIGAGSNGKPVIDIIIYNNYESFATLTIAEAEALIVSIRNAIHSVKG